MKKMKLLCAALTVIMLLTACSGSTSSAAEKVIGTTDKVVAADTLKPLAKADKEKLGYQLDMPEKGEEMCADNELRHHSHALFPGCRTESRVQL